MEKTLHFMWFQGIANAPQQIQNMPQRWKAMNPEYAVKVWDEKALLELIKNVYPRYLTFFTNIGYGESEKIRTIKKCDFARLLILFAFGGMYLDLDCEPIKPIRTFFEEGTVEHRLTPFTYSRNCSHPSKLPDYGNPTPTVFSRYELIVSREHCPNDQLGGFPIANTVMFGKAGSSLINDMIVSRLTKAEEKVLNFAGPFGLSTYIKSRVLELQGRVLVLPPYYFLWQVHDMGPPWKKTICCHHNRMDWVDWTSGNPTPWHV